jgi:hypothetical protein
MTKFDLGKFGTPLAIFAGILAIWVYLRGKSGTTQAIVNSPATNVPGVGAPNLPGLTQVLFQPGMGGGVGGPPQAVPSIQNVVDASNRPWDPNPGAPNFVIPSYLTYNYGPSFAFSKLPVAEMMAEKRGALSKGCGCGGSCGGCNTDCVSNCDLLNARYPDGRGGCLATAVKTGYVDRAAANIAGYAVNDTVIMPPPLANHGYASYGVGA